MAFKHIEAVDLWQFRVREHLAWVSGHLDQCEDIAMWVCAYSGSEHDVIGAESHLHLGLAFCLLDDDYLPLFSRLLPVCCANDRLELGPRMQTVLRGDASVDASARVAPQHHPRGLLRAVWSNIYLSAYSRISDPLAYFRVGI